MRIKTLAIIMLSAAAAMSCGEKKLTPDPGSTGPLPGRLTLASPTTEFSFSKDGNYTEGNNVLTSYEVAITSNRGWKAKSSDLWLEVTPASGKSGTENSISFSVTRNPNYQDQTATISLTCGDAVKVLTITQEGIGLRPGKPKFLLAGDSICTEYSEVAAPQTGWGQCLAAALGGDPQIVNLAIGGKSTKSFIDEGDWDNLLSQIDSGDVVIINFGHNDEKTDAAHHTTEAEYKTNLNTFITDVRTKGGSPVLVTPMSRRNFDDLGNPKRSHGDYPRFMRDLAAHKDKRVPLVDIEDMSFAWLAELGQDASESYYVVNKREGVDNDNTHLTLEGAQIVAGWIADGVKAAGLWIWSE